MFLQSTLENDYIMLIFFSETSSINSANIEGKGGPGEVGAGLAGSSKYSKTYSFDYLVIYRQISFKYSEQICKKKIKF